MKYEYVTVLPPKGVEEGVLENLRLGSHHTHRRLSRAETQEILGGYRTYRVSGHTGACCDRMSSNLSCGFVEFSPELSGPGKNRKPSLYLIFGDSESTYYWAFDYCPYCGTKVEYVEVRKMRGVYRQVEETVTREVLEEEEIRDEG